ncbi:hypothetical protein D3C78_1539670 [compost metagenome]
MKLFRQLARLEVELLHVVEAARVDHPHAPDQVLVVALFLAQHAIEEVEEHGVADPHDAGNQVHPANEQIEQFPEVRIHV